MGPNINLVNTVNANVYTELLIHSDDYRRFLSYALYASCGFSFSKR